MKRHIQQPGIRQWAGEDLLELQSEPLKALDGFFEEYGTCVIKGCHLTDNGDETYNLSPGLVALSGADNNGNATFKVVPFSGIEAMPLPVYLTLTYSVVERPYIDGRVKPIAYDYRAAVSAVKPESENYLELLVNSIPRFVDVIQNAEHRFFTDAEREKLQSIEKNANNYQHPAEHPAAIIVENAMRRFFTDAERKKLEGLNATDYATKSHSHTASEVSGLPTSLPANGGNADTIGGKAPSYFATASHTHDSICPYAIGGLYITKNSNNPAVHWPGTTWVKIEGRFLYGTSGSEGSGGTGGVPSVTLGVSNMPSHNHSLSVGTYDAGNHNHNAGNHRHQVDSHSHSQPSHQHISGHGRASGLPYADSQYGISNQYANRRVPNQTGDNYATLSFPYTSPSGGDSTGDSAPYTNYADSPTSINGNHSHSMWGSVGYEGSGSAFSIIPPYVKVHIWERQS